MQVHRDILKLAAGSRSWVILLVMALVVVASVLALAALDPGLRRSTVDLFGYGGAHSDEPSGSRDLFHTQIDIRGTRNGETYADYDKRRSADSADGFAGFGCAGSCVPHEEGFQWARSNNLTSEKQCRGNRWAVLEGCSAYVATLNPRR